MSEKASGRANLGHDDYLVARKIVLLDGLPKNDLRKAIRIYLYAEGK
jgi:hypothetical protein